MRQLVLFWLWLLLGTSQAQQLNQTTAESLWTTHSLTTLLQQCLSGAEAWQCLGAQAERLLDAACQDNSSWQLSEYLSIEPQQRSQSQQELQTGRAEAPGLAGKLLHLAAGRALRVRLPRQLTISNAIDEFGNELGLDQGTIARIDDKIDKIFAGLDKDTDKNKDKDRRKKKKKKKRMKGKDNT